MKNKIIPLLFGCLLLWNCEKEPVVIEKDIINLIEWERGKNEYMLDIDGINRQMIIYVPSSYNKDVETPLMFMFHGSGGTGEKMYDVTEWVAKSNREGFIVVFPTALKYFVVAKNKMQTKWSKYNLGAQLPVGTDVVDDLPFVKTMVTQIKASFNIDGKRIFGSGFSNGGGFCRSRLMLEMSDVFAALTGGGGWGIPYALRNVHPKESVPQYYIMGNKDPKILEAIGRSKPIPMNLDSAFSIEDRALEISVNNLILSSGLDTNFIQEYNNENSRAIFDKTKGVQQDYNVIMHLVKGLLHKYPKPENNPAKVSAVDLFWKFNMLHPKK